LLPASADDSGTKKSFFHFMCNNDICSGYTIVSGGVNFSISTWKQYTCFCCYTGIISYIGVALFHGGKLYFYIFPTQAAEAAAAR